MKRIVAALVLTLGVASAWGQYSGTGNFTQISSIASLTDGYYVIAYGTSFAMNNSYVSTTYLDKTAITPSGGVITNPSTSIVWKIQANGGGYTIYNEVAGYYISYTGSSNNLQVVTSVSSNNQRWSFAYTSSVFTVSNIAVTTRQLQYNSGSPRFACYTGTQNDLTLYKLTCAPPTPTFTTSPSSPLCANSYATYTTQSGQSAYTWSLPGTSGTDYLVTSGGTSATDNTVTLRWLSTGSKTVTVGYTSGGCASVSPASNTVSITSNSTGAPTGAANQSFCNGATVTNLSATPSPGGSISWYTTSSITSLQTALPTSNSLATGNYYASQTVGGCESFSRLPVAVTVYTSATTVAPSGSQSIPAGSNGTTLTVTDGTSSPISNEWKYSTTSGGPYISFTPVQTGTSYTPNFTVPNTYYVVEETTYGSPCNTTVRSNEVVITALANTITTTAATFGPFCNGTNNMLSVGFTSTGVFTGNFFVQISDASGNFPANSTANLISAGSPTSPITATIPMGYTAGSGYRVRVVNQTESIQSANNNGNSITITAVVTPSVAIVASPSGTICAGTNVTFTPTPTNGGAPTYRWWKNGIGTGTDLGVSPSYSSNTLANGDVIAAVMTSTVACVTSTTASSNNITMVVTTPVAPGSITGTSTVCQGQNTVGYSIVNVGGQTYNWSYSGSGYSGTSTTSSISGNFSTSATSGNISVSATLSGCTTSASTLAVTVNPLPAQPAAFSTSTSTVYVGQTGVNYAIPAVVGATGYSWNYTGTGATINGTGTSVTVDFSGTATAGTLSVYAVNACGNGVARTIAIAVTPSNDPCTNATSIAVNASTVSGTLVNSTLTAPFTKKDVWYKFTPICGGSHVITVTGFSGDVDIELFGGSCPAATTYLATSNGTTTTETITYGVTASTTYYVRVLAYNVPAENSVFTIQVAGATSVPAQPGIISGLVDPCSTGSQSYSISTVANSSSYTWVFPSGWAITSGTSTENVIVTASAISGNASVTANNGCGSSVARTLALTPIATPIAPVATAGNSVSTNSFTANWNTVGGASGYYVDVYTSTAATDLFISEYVEGSGNEKYIEIYNGTGTSVNLSNYQLILYANGSSTATSTVTLSGTLINGSTIVYKNSSASLYSGGTVNTAVNYNGNDAIALYKISTASNVDIIGKIGQDPGTEWTATGGYSTMDKTLVRKSTVFGGVTTNPASGFPTLGTEWDVYNTDDISHLGTHNFSTYVSGYENIYTTTNSLDVTGLNPGITYYYVARAENGSCPSPNSNQVAVSTTVCVPAVTVSSFLPASGPVGTMVKISGTGFSGTPVSNGVKFGNFFSSNYTINSNNSITAEVPSGIAASATVRVKDGSGCWGTGGNFALIDIVGSCTMTDLIISEIFDPTSGNNHYIEIFNGTSTSIDLNSPNNYTIEVLNLPSSTSHPFDITGTIAPGQVKVYYAGANGGLATAPAQGADAGFNADDEIRLRKNGVIIDRMIAPATDGYNWRRSTSVTGPNATYTASEWALKNTSSPVNTDIGIFSAGTNLTFTAHPTDQLCTFNMTATASGSITAYQWKYFNTGSNTWDNVTSAAFPFATIPSSGVGSPTSSSLSITGNTALYYDYQFYLEVRNASSCNRASYAAQFTYLTKPFYKAVVNGKWTTPATWQMSDNGSTGWVAACTYPLALNSQSIVIPSGITVNHNSADYNQTLDADKLTIDGELDLIGSVGLKMLNGQAATDLFVNGILNDGCTSGAGNGVSFEDNIGTANDASWQLGMTATLIKTNGSTASDYRDFYETGIANIPVTANWIYRYTGSNIGFASSSTTTPMYYPNLTLENTVAGTYSSSINTGNPNLSTFTMLGANNPIIIKGNFNVGGSGIGNINFTNINSHSPVEVDGSLVIKSGSTLTNDGGTTNFGNGLELKGNFTNAGTFTSIFNVANPNSGRLWLTGSTNQVVSGAGTFNLHNLRVNNAAGGSVTLNTNILVPDSLTLINGVVNTSASPNGLLTLGTTTSTVYGSPGTAAYINGPMSKQFASAVTTEFLYPIGKSSASPVYHPCSVLPVTLTGTNTIKSEYFAGAHQNNALMGANVLGITNKEYWDISKTSGPASDNLRVKLTYTNPGSGNWIYYNTSGPFYTAPWTDPCTNCNVAVVHRESGTNTWNFTASPGVFNAATPEYRYYTDNGDIYSGPLSSFSPFSIAYSYNIILLLPVKLLSFAGNLVVADGRLSWKIADAKDLAGFELEYSTDGQSWTKLADIAANSGTDYHYLHKALPGGTNYYRLLVKDKAGKSYYSQVVLLKVGKLRSYLVGLSPTIVSGELVPVIFSAQKQLAESIITDALGRKISSTRMQLEAGSNQWRINTGALARGVYFFTVITGDGLKETKRFIKE